MRQRKCCNAAKSSRWKSFVISAGRAKSSRNYASGSELTMAPTVAAVLVAAGRGLRAGGDLPKQYRQLAGEPVIRSCLSTFAWHGEVSLVQPVIHPDDRGRYELAAVEL